MYSVVGGYHLYRRTYCLHLQGGSVQSEKLVGLYRKVAKKMFLHTHGREGGDRE
jgi:hypothetical protein